MKHLSTLIFFSVLSLNMIAQTEQGTFYIALGNAYSPFSINGDVSSSVLSNSIALGYGHEWVTDYSVDDNDNWDDNHSKSNKNFSISGRIGYFAIDRLLGGIGLEYARLSLNEQIKIDNDHDGDFDLYKSSVSLSSYAISPFVKYYIPLGSNAFFVSTSYTYGNFEGKSESRWSNANDFDENEEIGPFTTYRIEFGSGMAFFVKESIAFEPSVNFAINSYAQKQRSIISQDQNGNDTYIENDLITSTNAIYFKLSASIFF